MWRRPVRRRRDIVDDYSNDEYLTDELVNLRCAGLEEICQFTEVFAACGISPSSRVLEIGSYVGAFLSVSRELGALAIGIDPNPRLINFTSSYGLDTRVGTVDDLLLETDSFDVVAVLNYLDQVPDPASDLRLVRTMLRPGGSVLIRTPNAEWLRSTYRSDDNERRIAACLAGVYGLPFARAFSLQALDRTLNAAGCRMGRRPRPLRPPP